MCLTGRQGVPIRIEVGPKDVAAKQVVLARRDTGEKYPVPMADVAVAVTNLLDIIQRDMLAKARRVRDEQLAVITEYVWFFPRSFSPLSITCTLLISGGAAAVCQVG